MRGAGALRYLGPALLPAGIATIALAVAEHRATLFLVLFVPVVTGGSALLGVGVLLMVLGLLTLPLAGTGRDAGELEPYVEAPPTGTSPGRPARSSGGLLLVGPVPIFVGSWRPAPRWIYWLAVLFGTLFLVGLVLTALLFF